MTKTRTMNVWASLVTVMAVLTIGAGAASGIGLDFGIFGNSENWEGSYEGDAHPNSLGSLWSTDCCGGNAAVNTNVMTEGSDTFIQTVGAGILESYYYEDLAGKLDPKTFGGAAMEIRFRKISGGHDTADMIMSDPNGAGGGGTYRFPRMHFSTTNVTYEAIPNTGPDLVGNINDDDWTILRLTSDDTSFTVFKDGDNPMPVYPSAGALGSNDARDGFQFRVFVSPNSTFDLDYLRWTDNAPPPVLPEPATLSLLGMTGLGLLRRRRSA